MFFRPQYVVYFPAAFAAAAGFSEDTAAADRGEFRLQLVYRREYAASGLLRAGELCREARLIGGGLRDTRLRHQPGGLRERSDDPRRGGRLRYLQGAE